MNVATFTGLMAAWVEEDIKNRTICAIIGEKQGDVMMTAVFQHGSERAVHLSVADAMEHADNPIGEEVARLVRIVENSCKKGCEK